MWIWMDRIGLLMFDAAFATAVFLTFIVLTMLGCRQPARRILLARVALLASLAIVPLVACGRLPRLYVIDTFVESRFFPKALFLAAEALDPPAADVEALTAPPGPGREVPWWLLERADVVRRWLPRGLTLLDLAFMGTGSAWMLLGIAGVHWLIRRSRPPSPAARAVFAKLVAAESGAAARADLRVCSRLKHPVVTGFLRPIILIPDALDCDGADPGPLRLSLLHELAHAGRSDHWFSTAAGVAQAVWFFLPHVWWIRSRLLIDQEFLADLSAAERYGTSSDYASSLLSLAAPETPVPTATSDRAPNRAAAIGATNGVQSPLFQRMMMLLHCPYPVEARTPRVWSWTSRFAVVLASIAAACLVIRWPQSSHAVPAPRPPFRAPQFVAEPIIDVDGQTRSRVYVLPVTLPARFELDAYVRCEADGTVPIRVVGHLIEIPGAPADPRSAESPASPGDFRDLPGWHHLKLHRESQTISIELDGRRVPDSGPPTTATGWLTIEPPPHHPVEFRDLVVTW